MIKKTEDNHYLNIINSQTKFSDKEIIISENRGGHSGNPTKLKPKNKKKFNLAQTGDVDYFEILLENGESDAYWISFTLSSYLKIDFEILDVDCNHKDFTFKVLEKELVLKQLDDKYIVNGHIKINNPSKKLTFLVKIKNLFLSDPDAKILFHPDTNNNVSIGDDEP